MAATAVEISDTLIITPATPISPSEVSLSHLDTDRNLNVTVRTLRLYPPSATAAAADPAAVIAAALSKSLSHYHPLAGTLRRRPSDSRLHITTTGDGVPLTIASSPLPLSSLLSSDPTSPLLDRLAPDPYRATALVHPLSLQLTRLSCGGLALGMCVHHSLCDGAGATQFLAAVAALARGADRPPIAPVWDRPTLLGPRSPPRVEVPTLNDILGFDHRHVASSSPYDSLTDGSLIRECFHVSEPLLNRFKTGLAEQAGSGSGFTAFEALGSFIWRARVKASEIPSNEEVKFVYSMNISKLLKRPALPPGYWGNVCVPVYVKLSVEKLLEQELWETAEMIRESKRGVTEEYVRSYIDFQELHYEKGITAGNGVSAFTDWRHLGHHDVDFGWGGPIAVSPLSWKLLGSVEPCFFLPYAAAAAEDGKKKDGFKVMVSLSEKAVAAFRMDMEMFSVED